MGDLKYTIKNKGVRKGFTLIELIVVMVVVVVLVLLAAPKYLSYQKDARLTKIKVDVKELETACQKYYMTYNDWPRLSDEAYTSDEIVSYGERILDKTGKVVILDESGNYYDIDYAKISNYIKEPTDGYNYILQNPVGNVFFIEGVTESRMNLKDKDYISNNKPEAVISIDGDGPVLYTGEVINWLHSGSTTPVGTVIDKVEWKGNQSVFSSEGLYKVELRVRNNLGIWSDWSVREIQIIKRSMFKGLSPEAFDSDNTTSYNSKLSTLKEVTWDENLDNKVLLLDLYANMNFSVTTTVAFYDIQGQLLSFIDLSGSIQTQKSLTKGRYTYSFVIPVGARKLYFTNGISESQGLYVDVYDISLAEQTKNPNPIMNLETIEDNYSVTLNWKQGDPNYAYSIILRDGVYHGKVSGFTYTDTPLYSNRKYTYTLIAIDKWGNASSKVEKSITTISDTVDFMGLSAAAFDNSSTTNFVTKFSNESTVTWQNGLSGRTVLLDCISSGSFGSRSTVYVQNSEGKEVSFLVNGVSKSSLALTSTRTTYRLELPEGAVKILFNHGSSGSNGTQTIVYSIKVE